MKLAFNRLQASADLSPHGFVVLCFQVFLQCRLFVPKPSDGRAQLKINPVSPLAAGLGSVGAGQTQLESM